MTNFTLNLSLFFMLSTMVFASPNNQKIEKRKATYNKVYILDKGVKREIKIPKEDNRTSQIHQFSTKQMDAKEGIMIKFKQVSTISLSEFETRYGLKLKHKLVSGYYIFENISDKSDGDILSAIIANENNLHTVKPNWKKRNLPR